MEDTMPLGDFSSEATPTTEEPSVPEAGGGGGSGKLVFDVSMLIIAVSCVGFLSNAFVVLVITKYKRMRERQGMMLIINQSAIDSVTSFLSICYFSVRLHYGILVSPSAGFAGKLFCRFYLPVLHWGLMLSSTYNLLAITSERYMMVVHPLYHKIHASKRHTIIVIAVVWVFGPAYRLIMVTPTRYLAPNQKCLRTWPTEDWELTFGVLSPMVYYFIPSLAMIIMYTHMIITLRRKVHPAPAAGGPASSTAQQNMSRSQRSLTKTLVLVSLAFISCWSINETYYFLMNMSLLHTYYADLQTASIVLVFLNCCINPFIYIFKYKEFRTGMRRLLGIRLAEEGAAGTIDATAASSVA